MSHDLPHHVDILLAPETVETLEATDHAHPVFEDLVEVIDDPDLIRTDTGMELRHKLDAIVSAEGMDVLADMADAEGDDLAAFCNALVSVAEPDTHGTMVSEIEEGEARTVHAFDPEFDPFEATAEVTPDDIEAAEQANNAMEEFINDLR